MADDIDFKLAMAGVRKLKKESVRPVSPKKLSARSLRSAIQSRTAQFDDPIQATPLERTNVAGNSNETGASHLFFLRDGQQNKILKDLKKGTRYPVSKVLDLHGLTKKNAQAKIDACFGGSNLKDTCLLIIHGKGLHSSNGATLKTFCADYLKTIRAVKAYCTAQLYDGGSGALYVLFR